MAKFENREISFTDGDVCNAAILFTVGFEGVNYALVRELGTDTFGIYEIRRGVLLQKKLHETEIPKRVKGIIGIIRKGNELSPKKYVCKGEHYEVTKETVDGEVRYRFEKKKRLYRFWCDKTALKNNLHYLLSVVVSAILFAFQISIWDYTLVGGIFPFADSKSLPYVVFAAYMLITTAGFCFYGKKKDIWSDLTAGAQPFYLTYIAAVLLYWKTALLVTAIITVIVIGIRFIWAIKKNEKLKNSLLSIFRQLAFAVMVSGIISIWVVTAEGIKLPVYTMPESHIQYDETVVEDYENTLSKLEYMSWRRATVDEKTEIIRNICDYECYEMLGVEPPEINVTTEKDDGLVAYYNRKTETVSINRFYFEYSPVETVIEAVLHECRHKWQHKVTELYEKLGDSEMKEYLDLSIFDGARGFSADFGNYQSGSDNYLGYYFQDVEVDARDWSEERVSDFYFDYMYPEKEEEAEIITVE